MEQPQKGSEVLKTVSKIIPEDKYDHKIIFLRTLDDKENKHQNDKREVFDVHDDNRQEFCIFAYILVVWWFFPFRKELKFETYHKNTKLLWSKYTDNKIHDDILQHICDFYRPNFYCTVGRIPDNFVRSNIFDCNCVFRNL